MARVVEYVTNDMSSRFEWLPLPGQIKPTPGWKLAEWDLNTGIHTLHVAGWKVVTATSVAIPGVPEPTIRHTLFLRYEPDPSLREQLRDAF